jgi:hypothetical protein
MSPTIPLGSRSVDDRLQAIEDRLDISNLLASHPPIVDSLSLELLSEIFTPDAVLSRGEHGSVPVRSLSNTATAMHDAAVMGLAHLSTAPYIKIGKNTALAFSYVCVTVRDPTADSIEVPAHGAGQGHRVFLIAANRWDLIRADGSWKLRGRKMVMCDGSDAPRQLARGVLDAVLVD